jgi:hypothetical protein
MTAAPSKSRARRWSACQVVDATGARGRSWQFSISGAQVTPHLHSAGADQGGPSRSGSWRELFQPRLNIAWLRPDLVFLRVLRLPKGEPDELPAMVELQLEKLSPLPVAQVVWSYELFPESDPETLTVVVLIAARSEVERHLESLEKQGFVPHRLELPVLHHVASENVEADTISLHLEWHEGQVVCVAAWRRERRLQSLDLLRLPDTPDGPARLVEQLKHMAWGGEFEGWFQGPGRWKLVMDPARVGPWETALRDWLGDALGVEAAASSQATALLAAQRAAARRSSADLVPEDFRTRYRQQFIDGLWMRGLGCLMALYLLGVACYAVAVQYYSFRRDRLSREVTALAPAYTNALVLRDRLRVFEEQAALKYAALDCMLTVSERLPEVMQLEAFNFQGGSRLFLAGLVSREDQGRVTAFNADLRRAQVGGQPLFEEAGVDAPKFAPSAGDKYRWDFTAKFHTPWLE